jgi:hypothetical protein
MAVTTDNGGGADKREHWRWTRDRERMGIYLLIGFLAVWLATMLTITGVMVVQHGYGLGIGGGQHVPHSIVKQIGVGDNLQKMMEATNKP